MNNPLVPQKRLDKNGQAVTRWVRVLENGEPGIKIPAPQSLALKEFATATFEKLFPGEDDAGYLIDMRGSTWLYSAPFVIHALETLPPKTLRKLSESVTGEKTVSQSYLSVSVNEYLGAMYDYRTEDGIGERYNTAVTDLNNVLVFHETLDTLASTVKYFMSPEDYPELLFSELSRYEVELGVRHKDARGEYGGPVLSSTVDYGNLPKRKQKEAIAYVIASRLTREYVSEKGSPSKSLVKLVYANLDRQKEIIALVQERGADDVQVLSEMIGSETPAISSGML